LLGRVSRAANREAATYSQAIGAAAPHTSTQNAPGGTTAKLYNIEEGIHLMIPEYLRNVQFDAYSSQVEEYEQGGYPVARLDRQYRGKAVIGFPTRPFITELADRLGLRHKVTAPQEATPEEQYRWVRLMEHFW